MTRASFLYTRTSPLSLAQAPSLSPLVKRTAVFPYGVHASAPKRTVETRTALADNGEVRVYKNDALVKTVILSAADQGFFNPKGGKVGVWSVLASQTFLDDFGGATVTP